MRRVLIVDDPRLAPRLARWHTVLGSRWDVVLAPPGQLNFWNTPTEWGSASTVAAFSEVNTLLANGEPTELLVAASTPEALTIASQLAFRRESQVSVLPAASQTADWIFSLYPLSEGNPPRVQGVLEHRSAGAVQFFQESLVGETTRRHLVVSCTLPVATLTEADVEARFVEDVDLLRRLGGEFKHLIAVAIPDGAQGLRGVTVNFGGEQAGTVAWSVQPGAAFGWQLKSGDGPGPILKRTADGEFRLEGWTGSPAPGGLSPFVPWENVLRAFDDLAAFRRSLKRRRLVELQTETISERAQFKSLMSASGCGLLMLTLVGAVALLGVGAALDPRESLQRNSERAELVLRAAAFRDRAAELSDEAKAEWPGMVRRLSQTPAPVLVEQSEEPSLDERRRNQLVDQLTKAGIDSPGSRVELYRFRGDYFLMLLTVAWVMLFLPLGIFLAVQGLLLAAPKAATTERRSPPT